MKQSNYSIRKIVQNGSTFYSVYVPAYLSHTGKKKYHYFHSRTDTDFAVYVLHKTAELQRTINLFASDLLEKYNQCKK